MGGLADAVQPMSVPDDGDGGGGTVVRVQVVKVPSVVGRLLQLILGLWAKH